MDIFSTLEIKGLLVDSPYKGSTKLNFDVFFGVLLNKQ